MAFSGGSQGAEPVVVVAFVVVSASSPRLCPPSSFS